mgnify:CR=1 FL=1
MKRPLAYITAPWGENEYENTENAARWCRQVYDAGFSPVCPLLFLPLFFVFTGLRTEIGLLNTPYLWGVCALFIVMSIAGKLLGATLSARAVGESWKDSLSIGVLMNTRGLMELIVLNIGYEMGIIPGSLFVLSLIHI